MLTLVLADSLVLLFAAWEAVGLASFLLIGFHFQEPAARRAALLAFVVTRFGDLGLLLGWLFLVDRTGTAAIAEVLGQAQTGALTGAELTLVTLLLFGAVVGKSAQLPLTAWLPAAMAGPTPVSALIHSATMVAAGVFLVLRLFPLFQAAPATLSVLLWVGLGTALLAAVIATVQMDLKRVLAWSTASQLGEMVLALGVAAPLGAAFHLATQASFKAGLFLAAGAVDHGAGSRDLRHLGGLWRRMPVTSAALAVSGLALAGIPPFAGFWSEELLLAAAVRHGPWLGAVVLGLIGLAGLYMGRAAAAVLFRWPGAPEPEATDPGRPMLAGLAGLAIAAVGVGVLLQAWGTEVLPYPEEPGAGVAWRWAPWPWRWPVLPPGVCWSAAGGRSRRWPPSHGPSRGRSKGAVVGPGRLVLALAGAVDRVELLLDGAAGAAGRWARHAAGVVDRLEGGLDRGALAAGGGGLAAARLVDQVEDGAFAPGGDGLGRTLSRGGGLLRGAESGRVYLYTLALFLWLGAAVLLSYVWWR